MAFVAYLRRIDPRLAAHRTRTAEGRDYDAIEKTVPFGFDVGADGSKAGEVVEQLRGLADLGAESVLGWVVNVEQIRPLEIMGREVIPAIAEFGAGRAVAGSPC